jgi:hypothetical protein
VVPACAAPAIAAIATVTASNPFPTISAPLLADH